VIVDQGGVDDSRIGIGRADRPAGTKRRTETLALLREMVPLAGIEPALLAELDFESSASTNSATGAIATTAGAGCEAGGI
jgi:hypothetical protein